MTNPNSPLATPVGELPTWLIQRTRGGLLGNSRVRMILVAVGCILLGYLVTSSFGSGEEVRSTESNYLNPYSGSESPEVLDGPAGFGSRLEDSYRGREMANAAGGETSISGALSDLHHAVSGKLSSFKDQLTSNTKAGKVGGVVSSGGVFTDVEKHNVSSPVDLNSTGATETIVQPTREGFGEKTRIGKCTIIFGGAAIYERAVKTHELHDRMHGYPLHVLRHGIMDDVWSKPAYILNLLLRELTKPEGERLQWLLWFDADTVLLNPHIPIEAFLPPSPEFDDIHMLVTRDWNGLNNGVFPVRVTQWAVDLFAAIVAFRQYRPEIPLVFRDQQAMDILLKERKFAAHIADAPQRWFNAYQGEHNETLQPYQVRRGDFLVHFAGVGDRNERMGYWLDRVEQHLPDWELEIQHTSYPAEVRDFWAQQRAGRSSAASVMMELRKESSELLLQTDQQVAEYNARLLDTETSLITEKQTQLRQSLEQPDLDAIRLEESITALRTARAPLEIILAQVNKVLLKEAQDTIFAAQKDVFDGTPINDAELLGIIEEKTLYLKNIVLQPTWTKADLNTAIEDVRQARAKLNGVSLPSQADVLAAGRIKELEAINAAAEKEKAALLGLNGTPAIPTPAPTPVDGLVVEYVQVTHTALEMTTHVHWVMETVTANPGMN